MSRGAIRLDKASLNQEERKVIIKKRSFRMVTLCTGYV